ncbi:MAG: hypothetical protein QW818_02595 [Candidatus Aenigmatarchaeota archaeon]
MEGIENFLMGLVLRSPILMLVLAGLGTILIVAQVIVLMTPSKEDDKFLDKIRSFPFLSGILNFIESFAPIQKRSDGKLTLSSSKQKES